MIIKQLGKTSHQAISHRVKSISMSNWSLDEVRELTDHQSGGNLAAQHIWLEKAPPTGGKYNSSIYSYIYY